MDPPAREDEPLLSRSEDGSDMLLSERERAEHRLALDSADTIADAVPQEKRRLGLSSTSFLIFNRVIGTSIFATPSVILRASGSVGLSFVMWLIGAIVAACGTAVYIELGTGLPRSGGEKNYLEYMYQRPRFLATCAYSAYALLLGWGAANSSVFGDYVLHAFNPAQTPPELATRLAGVLCVTTAFLLHGLRPRWGIAVQDTLGVLKLIALAAIALSGLAALARIPGFAVPDPPSNFAWSHLWEGSGKNGMTAFVMGIFTVVWSFVGFSNANYALSEVRDPVRTIKRAAPLAMSGITVAYFLANMAYFAVVPKEEILGSGRIVAALFFGKLWGVGAERIVSVIVAMSALANVLVVIFAHGRVIQELGREGVIPFSGLFASDRPFGAPLMGLLEQWLLTSLMVLTVPSGDAYLFMLNMVAYPYALVNAFVSAGLLLLHAPPAIRRRLLPTDKLDSDWQPPFRAWTPVVLFFFLANLFLVLAPYIPPAPGFKVYQNLPYWLHAAVASLIPFIGVAYWYVNWVWLPRRGQYTLVRDWIREDGTVRGVFRKVEAGAGQLGL